MKKKKEDREFIRKLYEQQKERMYQTARYFLRDAASVEDALSQSCVSLFDHVELLRALPERQRAAYVLHTVRNQALKQLEQQKKMAEKAERLYWETATQEDVERQVVMRDTLAHVLRAISTLPEKERQVVTLKSLHQMSDAEVAEQVGLSVESVRKYLSRARKKLRPILEEGERDE